MTWGLPAFFFQGPGLIPLRINMGDHNGVAFLSHLSYSTLSSRNQMYSFIAIFIIVTLTEVTQNWKF